jgi:hypothetical protein
LRKPLRHKGLERSERSGVTPAKRAVALLKDKRKAGLLGKVAKRWTERRGGSKFSEIHESPSRQALNLNLNLLGRPAPASASRSGSPIINVNGGFVGDL